MFHKDNQQKTPEALGKEEKVFHNRISLIYFFWNNFAKEKSGQEIGWRIRRWFSINHAEKIAKTCDFAIFKEDEGGDVCIFWQKSHYQVIMPKFGREKFLEEACIG